MSTVLMVAGIGLPIVLTLIAVGFMIARPKAAPPPEE